MLASSRFALLIIIASALLPDQTSAAPPAGPEKPKVVLVGDSIRLSYAPLVAEQLAGRATVVSPAANGGDSSNVLQHLDAWVIRERPDLVHFNCGIHDTKKSKTTGQFQVPPEQYAANLRRIVDRIRRETGATVVFATTTPILDERAARTRSGRDYELLDASVAQYNQIAKTVMQQLDVPVNDLHQRLTDAKQPATVANLIGDDGVHLLPPGRELLGRAVAEFVRERLPVADAGRAP